MINLAQPHKKCTKISNVSTDNFNLLQTHFHFIIINACSLEVVDQIKTLTKMHKHSQYTCKHKSKQVGE